MSTKKLLDYFPDLRSEFIKEALTEASLEDLKKALAEKAKSADPAQIDKDIEAWAANRGEDK